MTRSVKDLRDLICVSRLSTQGNEEDEDLDLSRPLSSLSIFGEKSLAANGNVHDAFKSQKYPSSTLIDGFAVPKPPSSARGKRSRVESGMRPQSSHSQSLLDGSGFNLGNTPARLPPVGGGSRPSSSSSSGSDRSGSRESHQDCFDNILRHIGEDTVTEWLQRTTDMLNELVMWCADLDNFVDFAQFWLTEFPEGQRLNIYKLELSIIVDELIAAIGESYRQGRVCPSDLNRLIAAILNEYPTKLCSAQGPHVFLDILDTVTSNKTQAYKQLLTAVKVSTNDRSHAQCLLALRAFSLVSIWNNIVKFYRRVSPQPLRAGGTVADPAKLAGGDPARIAKQRLFLAVEKGYVSVVYYFLRNGRVSKDVRDDQGRTLTFAAVLANQSNVLHYLVTKHKDSLPVDKPGESGNAPLHAAASWNYVDCIQVLVIRGNADVNVCNPQCNNATPLHMAVMQGHLEACEALVTAGASLTASISSTTPLQLARDMGHEDIFQFLVKRSRQTASEEAMDTDALDNS